MCKRRVTTWKVRWFAVVVVALLLGVVRPAPAAALVEGVSKELEYIDALVTQGEESGQLPYLEKAHRTLANLAVTNQAVESPRDRVLMYLSISYFYVRMCGIVPLLQLSSTANPTGFDVDCVAQSTKYFDMALTEAVAHLERAELGDTHFYVGMGYDAMRGYLADIPGSDLTRLHKKAQDEIAMAVQIGTSFDGAKHVLARFSSMPADSPDTVVAEDTFLQMHRLFYMERVFANPPVDTGVGPDHTPITSMPVDEKNVYMDYRWRFSIQKPDDTWQFATGTTQTQFKLSVFQDPEVSQSHSVLTLVAQQLDEAQAALPLKELVSNSTKVLVQAGYAIESQKESEFRSRQAYEIVLKYSYQDLGVLEGSEGEENKPAPLGTKHYMFVVAANNILYILSFNSLESEYSKIFPDLKMIANTFTPF